MSGHTCTHTHIHTHRTTTVTLAAHARRGLIISVIIIDNRVHKCVNKVVHRELSGWCSCVPKRKQVVYNYNQECACSAQAGH